MVGTQMHGGEPKCIVGNPNTWWEPKHIVGDPFSYVSIARAAWAATSAKLGDRGAETSLPTQGPSLSGLHPAYLLFEKPPLKISGKKLWIYLGGCRSNTQLHPVRILNFVLSASGWLQNHCKYCCFCIPGFKINIKSYVVAYQVSKSLWILLCLDTGLQNRCN